jgi:hypothetical protein
MTDTESLSDGSIEWQTGLEAWDEKIENVLKYVVIDEGVWGQYTAWDEWQEQMRRNVDEGARDLREEAREWERKAIEISNL